MQISDNDDRGLTIIDIYYILLCVEKKLNKIKILFLPLQNNVVGRFFMLFDGVRQSDTLYVASVSRGKDSTAMLRAIQIMGWPLDMILSVDIWFDEATPAELPSLASYKREWDSKCFNMFGVPVTRLCAKHKGTVNKLTYHDIFYSPLKSKGRIYGFPMRNGNWCTSALKNRAFSQFYSTLQSQNIITYCGIAADEPERIKRHITKPDMVLPLVQIGWDEDLCGLEAAYMKMLSPVYDGACRDGCWFCHNQGVGQLRNLRNNYPDLWQKLLQLDADSPVVFRSDGHTVHDFEARFSLEDDGYLLEDLPFRWSSTLFPQMNFFML